MLPSCMHRMDNPPTTYSAEPCYNTRQYLSQEALRALKSEFLCPSRMIHVGASRSTSRSLRPKPKTRMGGFSRSKSVPVGAATVPVRRQVTFAATPMPEKDRSGVRLPSIRGVQDQARSVEVPRRRKAPSFARFAQSLVDEETLMQPHPSPEVLDLMAGAAGAGVRVMDHQYRSLRAAIARDRMI